MKISITKTGGPGVTVRAMVQVDDLEPALADRARTSLGGDALANKVEESADPSRVDQYEYEVAISGDDLEPRRLVLRESQLDDETLSLLDELVTRAVEEKIARPDSQTG